MTTSLYQRASAAGAASTRAPPASVSEEVVEVMFGTDASPDAEDMCRGVPRVEGDVIARAAPQISCVGQQIVCLEGALLRDVERRQIEVEPACLHVMRIEGHDHEQAVTTGTRLAVGDEGIVLDAVKYEASIALQRGVL